MSVQSLAKMFSQGQNNTNSTETNPKPEKKKINQALLNIFDTKKNKSH